jgi:hypothetical protein
MVAGILLILETGGFLMSGWTAEKFSSPEQAIQLLHTGGDALRAAAVFGFLGLATTTILLAGLASTLHRSAPAAAAAALYLGLIGIAGHSLVPLGLWIGVPTFTAMATHNLALAQSSWAAFQAVSDAAHGIGSLFNGCSMLFAGLAMLHAADWPKLLASVSIGAGVLTLATLLCVGTSIAGAGGMLFMPALALTVACRFWSGLQLRLAPRPDSEVKAAG